jgi:hypothetical protein
MVTDPVTGKAVRKHTDARIKELLKGKEPHKNLLDDLLAAARAKAAPGKTPDVGKGLTGSSEMVERFLEHLKNTAKAESDSSTAAKQLLAKLHSPALQTMQEGRFAPPERFTQVLKKFKNPRNLALAAGGIGLGTYGLTGLGEKLWGKKN